MAKDLPYFKFNPSEWISGLITLEDLNTQGAFINICAYYWIKSGNVTLTEIKRRVKLKQATIKRLVDSGIVKIQDDNIEISFLRQQFDERGHISERNSKNGSLGGAPKGNANASKQREIEEKNNRKTTEKQPKTTNIEEKRIRIEEKREDIYIKAFGFFDSQKNFFTIQSKFAGGLTCRVNGEDGMKELFDSQMSIVRNPEKINAFMAAKNGAQFNDFMHVFNTYNKFLDAPEVIIGANGSHKPQLVSLDNL